MYALLPLLALLLGWCIHKRKNRKMTKVVLVVGVILSLAFFALPILQIGGPMKVLALDVVLSGCLLVFIPLTGK